MSIKEEPNPTELGQNKSEIIKPDISDDFRKVLFGLIEAKEATNKNLRWLPDGKSFIIQRPNEFDAEFLSENFGVANWNEFREKLEKNFEVSGNGPIHCQSTDENFQDGKDFMKDTIVETNFDKEMRKKLRGRGKSDLIDIILDKHQEISERDEKLATLTQQHRNG